MAIYSAGVITSIGDGVFALGICVGELVMPKSTRLLADLSGRLPYSVGLPSFSRRPNNNVYIHTPHPHVAPKLNTVYTNLAAQPVRLCNSYEYNVAADTNLVSRAYRI